MPKPGKLLEAVARAIRPYLSSAYRKAYANLVARGLRERREGEPIVCCDFANPAIDAVGGRYYFSLVRDLIDAGFFPVFTARRATLSSFGTSRMKSLLLKERLGVIGGLHELREPFFLITDLSAPPPAHARRVVRVSYARRLCGAAAELAFPVFMHPRLTAAAAAPEPEPPASHRPVRIFFGGNTTADKYDHQILRDVYGMLTRREMLETVCSAIPASQIHRPVAALAWLASRDEHPFVLCETQHCKIPQDRWLEALSKADFFLACPGVGMPLCHNLIEAMAAGCVPILQYGAYLTPPLQDRVNCMAFKDADGLREVLTLVLTMSQDEIRGMRANVRAHYDRHLAPGRFAQRLFSGPHDQVTLLMNAYRVPRGSCPPMPCGVAE